MWLYSYQDSKTEKIELFKYDYAQTKFLFKWEKQWEFFSFSHCNFKY